MSELATLHLALAVPLAIERYRERGGVTERDILWAQQKMQQIRDGAGGHAIAYLDKGQTAHETALLTEMLAILSYIPGGVRFAGLHFDAEQPAMRLVLDDALLRELEPFRQAMEREEAMSRNLDEVSEQELARLRELEVLLMQAADRGDTVQQALIEAEVTTLLSGTGACSTQRGYDRTGASEFNHSYLPMQTPHQEKTVHERNATG